MNISVFDSHVVFAYELSSRYDTSILGLRGRAVISVQRFDSKFLRGFHVTFQIPRLGTRHSLKALTFGFLGEDLYKPSYSFHLVLYLSNSQIFSTLPVLLVSGDFSLSQPFFLQFNDRMAFGSDSDNDSAKEHPLV